MKDYSDINYIKTSFPGLVILRAGREIVKTRGGFLERWDVSIQVPEEFAETLIRWKDNALRTEKHIISEEKVEQKRDKEILKSRGR